MDHTIVHFEIPAKDIQDLKKFYSRLFGWKIAKAPGMDYWLIQTVPVDEQGRPKGVGVNGGMMKNRTPHTNSHTTFWWNQSTNTARRSSNWEAKS